MTPIISPAGIAPLDIPSATFGTSPTRTLPETPLVSTAVHPIVPGFHPDPSICRVGEDYYLVHSSFEYSPGVPLWHSRDLLQWTLLGNILDREEQLPAGKSRPSGGVFAPTIRHHAGRFWLITTNVSGVGQLIVSAGDPAGPWSKPMALPGVHGIDPDLAWDDDGRCLVTYCSADPSLPGIAQVSVDLQTGTTLGEPVIIWGGTGLAFPEAPHLYRVNGWWYLVLAEGGTERGHGVTVGRSKYPSGPFSADPSNPVLSHRSTTHPVQNTGHADLIDLPDGSWAVVYLGVRARGTTPLFHVIGRETFLAGIDWIDDWPVVDEDRFSRHPSPTSFQDALDTENLNPRWISPGEALDSFMTRSQRGGATLRPGRGTNGSPNAAMTRLLDLRWQFEVDVDVARGTGGLLLRLDDRHWYEIRADDAAACVVVNIGGIESRVGDRRNLKTTNVTLRVSAVASATGGPDDIELAVIADDEKLVLACIDGRYLSTEVAGGFTGRVVGARAVDGTVDIREVRYEGKD